jgi:hypothetical protein
LAVLITAMRRIEQQRLPVVLMGAGLPQPRGRMGNAKSYAERLSNYSEIGVLPAPAVGRAIRAPLEKTHRPGRRMASCVTSPSSVRIKPLGTERRPSRPFPPMMQFCIGK